MSDRFKIIGVFVGIAGIPAFLALNFYYKKPHDLTEVLLVFMYCVGIGSTLDCGRLLLQNLVRGQPDLGDFRNHWYILMLGVLAFTYVVTNKLINMVLAVIEYTP